MDTTRWDEILEYLQGSCESLSNALELFNAPDLANNTEFLAYLDNTYFNCTCCGWWCDLGEEASAFYGLEELTCEDCCQQDVTSCDSCGHDFKNSEITVHEDNCFCPNCILEAE